MKSLTWAAAVTAAILVLSGVVAAQEQQVPIPRQEEEQLRGEEIPNVEEMAQQIRELLQLNQTIDQLRQRAIIGDRMISLGYTCDSTTDKCTCIGTSDCNDMGKSGRCEGDLGCGFFTCTCDWKLGP